MKQKTIIDTVFLENNQTEKARKSSNLTFSEAGSGKEHDTKEEKTFEYLTEFPEEFRDQLYGEE